MVHVEIEAVVLDYLEDPGRNLSYEDIEKLLDLLEGFSETGDFYRNDPSHRCAPGSDCFQVDYAFMDSKGTPRHFRLVISDADAASGVLVVRYVDEL